MADGRPTVDEFPVDAIRAAGDAEAAPLIFAPRQAVRPVVFPVDVEEPHLVAARGVRIAVVAMHAEQFVEVREVLRALSVIAFLGEKNVRPLSIDEREVEARFVPSNAVVALRVAARPMARLDTTF